jgi:hypothetical protein
MVEEPMEEVSRRCPETPLMEVCKADDVADGRVRLIFVARDDLLWLRGIRHRMKVPILDEPQHDLLGEARTTPRIHGDGCESTSVATATAVAVG